MYITIKLIYLYIAILLLLIGCKANNPANTDPPCGNIDPGIVPESPYDSPIWHPGGNFIGFNHTPLKSIDYPKGKECQGVQHFAGDSAGFWLINSDGTNLRRIFKYKLLAPSWSPDGEWIAFNSYVGGEVHIFKMHFNGKDFDTTTLTQLTSEGRNFLPTWSPDGQWIAYNKSICDGPNTCGIWMLRSDGKLNSFISAYGNFPAWNHESDKILFITRAVTSGGQVIGDSLWFFDIKAHKKEYFTFLGGNNYNNRYPKYSPDYTKIAIWSISNLWLMDSSGSNLHQITTEGVDVDFGTPYSWSPDGKNIVYTDYRSDDWGYENGTLWILNQDTGEKKQLTFNHN